MPVETNSFILRYDRMQLPNKNKQNSNYSTEKPAEVEVASTNLHSAASAASADASVVFVLILLHEAAAAVPPIFQAIYSAVFPRGSIYSMSVWFTL